VNRTPIDRYPRSMTPGNENPGRATCPESAFAKLVSGEVLDLSPAEAARYV
jgi:hypothetical protein